MNKQNRDAVDWLRAWRHRCCPPDYILHGKMSTKLNRHLELCPWCRNDLELGPTGFQRPDDLTPDGSGPKPAPGQLWSISDKLGGWGPKNRYYNPPLVLIIDQPDPHALNVLQACDDMTFIGPDDVLLDNERRGFAQPWNRYTLRKNDLGFYFGSVTEGLVKKLTEEPSLPAEKVNPGSLRWFFRQMEVETGFFFASRAMQALMGQYEMDNTEQDNACHNNLPGYKNTSELLADIHHLPLQYPESQSQNVPLPVALAALQPEVELLPKAAKDSENSVTGLVFILENDRIKAVQTTKVVITHLVCRGEMLHVSGQIPAADEDSMTFLLYWRCDSQFIEPIPGESGCRENVFWAIFPVGEHKNPMQGELVVRILAEK